MKTLKSKSGNYFLLLLLSMILFPGMILSQNQQANTGSQSQKRNPGVAVHPTMVATGTFWGLSRPLREIPAMTAAEQQALRLKLGSRILNAEMHDRSYRFADKALPKGEDGARQKGMGTLKNVMSPLVNFEGQSTSSYPPDDNGAAGPNHYMQTVNMTYTIYDKAGTLLAGPTNLNLIFGNVPGAGRNDGDPIILYDEQADRWLVTEFSIPDPGQDYILMAVSSTNDPTGTWYQYSFPADKMPDYPKFGVWRDGYYMGDNNTNGTNDTYVYERSQMLTGQTAQVVAFKNPNRPGGTSGFRVVPPLDNDGPFAPSGSPGLYIAFNDDAESGGTDQLWIYELAVDWTNPTASTFNRVQQIDVEPFNSNFGTSWDNIRQKGSSQKVDAVPQIIMNVPQYRNFGSYQSIVCCHTVNVDGKNTAGIRWYELRKTDASWSIRQQSTYAPDTNSRWMGCIMLNGHNTIALGYSVSSDGEYPGIRYCGQSPTAYQAGNSTMDIREDTIWTGSASQTGANRWGDYSVLALDPTDDETFWYTNQYEGSSDRQTRIASFKLKDPVGISNLASTNSSKVKIYPNPTKGIFRIVPENQEGLPLNVMIEDQNRKVILNQNFSGKKEYIIDLSRYSQGAYDIFIKTADWLVSSKLVIVR